MRGVPRRKKTSFEGLWVEGVRDCGEVPQRQRPRLTERNTKMKLTKVQIKEKQAELVEVLLKIDEFTKLKKSLVAILEEDIAGNEEKYRNGIVTPRGILVRKPKWNFEAKPVVEAA